MPGFIKEDTITQTVSEGLEDRGLIREQWGSYSNVLDGADTQLFPLPFKEDTIPNVQLTIALDEGGDGVGLVNGTIDHLGFSSNRPNDIDNTVNPVVYWRAIGYKP